MSTRCNIVVKDDYDSIQLYRHSDGYPEGKSGVIFELKEALNFAWKLPRMEADEFAAAIIRAWKNGSGNIYIDGTAKLPKSLHGDIDYYYIISPDKTNWRIEVFDGCDPESKIWEGHIGDVYPDIEYPDIKIT